jgi:uncharacterized damage-inducible protein DinB
MDRPAVLKPFYEGWADQHRKLIDSIRPLTPEQMQLRPAPGEWAIWQLASNIAGGRVYWLCSMLGEDDRGLVQALRAGATTGPATTIDLRGWEDDVEHPRTADELVDVLERTWSVVEGCLDRWSLDDLQVEVTSTDAWGQLRTITPGWVLWRLMSHDVHHGSEIALILRVHGLPTAIKL